MTIDIEREKTAKYMRNMIKLYDEWAADHAAQDFGTPYTAWLAAKYPCEVIAARASIPPATPDAALVAACRDLVAYLDKHKPMAEALWCVSRIRAALAVVEGQAEATTGAPLWISVDFMLPETGVEVLIDGHEGVEVAHYSEAEEDQTDQIGHDAGFWGYKFAACGRSFGNPAYIRPAQGQPKYWMHLPDSPRDGDENGEPFADSAEVLAGRFHALGRKESDETESKGRP